MYLGSDQHFPSVEATEEEERERDITSVPASLAD